MRIEVVTGTEAERLLVQESFLAQWSALHDRCPWATSFQSHRFLRVWYEVYPDHFAPVLVLSRHADGTLRGLLALAQSRRTTKLVAAEALIVAGWDQAEYHSWICAPADGDRFPLHATRALRHAFPKAAITFRYLAPGTPLSWLKSPEGRQHCIAKPYRRPLLRLGDGSEVGQSLKKSSNKSRLKRLEKLGGFEFRRVTDVAEYESLFDRIVTLYDLRHGAVQGSDGFCTIERQKEFHAGMMKAGLLHATVMKAGGELAAAHFGVIGRRELQLGTIVNNPLLAKHSPGKFQVLLLARMLHEEGFAQFDLTPGGDTYKERFANAADEAHVLLVLPTPATRARARLRWRVMDTTKRMLARFGWSPAEARFRVRQLRQHPGRVAARLIDQAREWGWSTRELCVHLRDTALPVQVRGSVHVRRDALGDLLRYDPADARESRQAFLTRALRRLESGQHCYTVTEAGRLRCCVWLDEQPGPDLEGVGNLAGFSIPANSALIQDYRAFGARGDLPSATDVLRAVLADVAAQKRIRRAVLVVAADEDESLTHAAPRLGFEHASTLVRVARLGHTKWIGVHPTSDLLLPRGVAMASPADDASKVTKTGIPRRSGSSAVSGGGGGGGGEDVEAAGMV